MQLFRPNLLLLVFLSLMIGNNSLSASDCFVNFTRYSGGGTLTLNGWVTEGSGVAPASAFPFSLKDGVTFYAMGYESSIRLDLNKWQSLWFTTTCGFLGEFENSSKHFTNIYIKNNSTNSSQVYQQNEDSLMDLSSKIHLVYDEKNLLSSLSNSQGAVLQFLYDENYKIRKIIDEFGTVLFDASVHGYEEELDASRNSGLENSRDKKIDKIRLCINGRKTSFNECHEINYFQDTQNVWRFSYRRILNPFSSCYKPYVILSNLQRRNCMVQHSKA